MLAATVVIVYGIALNTLLPLILATLAATVGVAATGTLYGVLAAGLRVRETLVPVLLLPVVAPVLLGATRAWEAAIDGIPSDAWPWVALLEDLALLFHHDRDAGLRTAPGGSMRLPETAGGQGARMALVAVGHRARVVRPLGCATGRGCRADAANV